MGRLMKTKDTDRQIQEIWELFREVAERCQETHRKFKETDRKMENLLESIRESDQKVNKIAGRWGRFVEGLILPAIEELFAERGNLVDKIFRNVRYHKNGTEGEIDILAMDGEYAVLIEVKSTLAGLVCDWRKRGYGEDFERPENSTQNLVRGC